MTGAVDIQDSLLAMAPLKTRLGVTAMPHCGHRAPGTRFLAACGRATCLLCLLAAALPGSPGQGASVPKVPTVSPRRALFLALAAPSPASAESVWTATVGCDGAKDSANCFTTVTEALRAIPKDSGTALVTVAAGTYREQVRVPRGPVLTLESSPPNAATLVWESDRPYEAALTAEQGSQVTVRGFNIKHAGKSVANNYAVFSPGGDLSLEDCDVMSSTGAGVAAEGGRLSLQRCRVHDCARQGAVLFGPIIGDEPLQARCSCSVFSGNGQFLGDGDAIPGPFDGVLARNNVEASISDVVIEGSGLAGLAVTYSAFG